MSNLKVPTRQEVKEVILGNDCKMTNFLGMLYSRWLDEKEYEDIEDYRKAIENNLKYPITNMKKRPFSFEIATSDNFIMIVKINSRTIELLSKNA